MDAHHLSVDRLRRGGRFDRFLFRSMLDIYRLWRDGSLLASSLRLRAWPAAAPTPRGERVAAFSFGIHLMTVTTARGCNHFYSAIDFVHTLFSVRNAGRDHTRFRLLDEACAKAR